MRSSSHRIHSGSKGMLKIAHPCPVLPPDSLFGSIARTRQAAIRRNRAAMRHRLRQVRGTVAKQRKARHNLTDYARSYMRRARAAATLKVLGVARTLGQRAAPVTQHGCFIRRCSRADWWVAGRRESTLYRRALRAAPLSARQICGDRRSVCINVGVDNGLTAQRVAVSRSHRAVCT